MVSRFVFPVWFSLHLPWWDGSGFAFQVGRDKWEKLQSTHENKLSIRWDLNGNAQKLVTLGKNTQLGMEEVLAQS